jgi:hypothetical protein
MGLIKFNYEAFKMHLFSERSDGKTLIIVLISFRENDDLHQHLSLVIDKG